jgi:hypothetical protein
MKIEKGELFEGIFRLKKNMRHIGLVIVPDLKLQILIDGDIKINRALDGDTVVIRLDDFKLWTPL